MKTFETKGKIQQNHLRLGVLRDSLRDKVTFELSLEKEYDREKQGGQIYK